MAKIVDMTDNSITVIPASAQEIATARMKYDDNMRKLADAYPDAIQPSTEYMSRMINDGKRMPKRALNAVIDILNRNNPNARINLVDNTTTERPGVKGYFKAGELYYNTDEVTFDTPLHEFAHPMLINMVNSTDPVLKAMGESFMQLAQDQIDNNTELYNRIKQAYGELSPMDVKYEIAATIIGFESEIKVKRLVEDSKSLWDKVKDAVQNFWSQLKDTLSRMFTGENTRDNYQQYTPTLPQYSIDSTQQDLVNHIIDMAINGQADVLMSEVDVLDHANAYYSKVFTNPILDVRDLEEAMLLGGNITDMALIRSEYSVNSIFNSIMADPDHQYRIGGQNFDYKPLVGSLSEDSIKKKNLARYSP